MPESIRQPGQRIPAIHLLAALCLLAACGQAPGPDARSVRPLTGGDAAGAAEEPSAGISETVGSRSGAAETGSAFVGSVACGSCHESQMQDWRGSHHDRAMQTASEQTVLGDFDNTTFERDGVVSRFYRRDNAYFVETDGADGELAEFRVTHTFGVEPLQQYLVEHERGRLQALSIAWDTRPESEGGQQWFHLYGSEPIPAGDPLHWTGPYQNWNGMCADCHSTSVAKAYDVESDSFETGYAEEDVACEACHGPGSAHVQAPATAGMILGSVIRNWVASSDAPIAARSGEAPPRNEADTCAQCHSRRAQLRDVVPGGAYLDGYRPELLNGGLYHPDGQILEEVYVYGSFLQSAMAQAGVVCSDCHDPHSLELRADGNALCSQCHLASAFDTVGHHRHEGGGDQPLCVDCHMRSETFMVVDPRRDHSFRVPRPDLTVAHGSPNACNDCHADRTADWAADRVAAWFPDGRFTQMHFGSAFDAADRWQADRSSRLRDVAASPDLPGIVRASAVRRLGTQLDAPAIDLLRELAGDDDALIRLGVIEAARSLGTGQRIDLVQRFLSDAELSLRVTAAETLAPVRARLSAGRQMDLDAAAGAALAAYTYSSDRPEGLVGRASLLTALGRTGEAERDLLTATVRFPWYTPAWLNLADHYRATGRESAAFDLLIERADAGADDASLMLALGLAQVRQGDYESAVESLQSAAMLAPDDPYFTYVFGVGLSSVGNTDEALAVLEAAGDRFPGYRETWYALATISRDLGERENSIRYARRLLEIAPGDSAALALLRELGAR